MLPAIIIDLLIEVFDRFFWYFFVQLLISPLFKLFIKWVGRRGPIGAQIATHLVDKHDEPDPRKCNEDGCHIIPSS